MVKLETMNADEFAVFLEHLMEGYAQDLARNLEMPIEAARERSRNQTGELLAQGLDTPNHLLYVVRAEGVAENAGYLWVFIDEARKVGFIYDIEIAEALRGKGLGRSTILALEDQLRAQGIEKLDLHVFGDNPAAIHLYQSLGFGIISMNMRKRL